MVDKKSWLEEVAAQNEREAAASDKLIAKLRPTSDTELRLLIGGLTALGKARSIAQNETLSALLELQNLRSTVTCH